jgi:hypothetical protein
MADSLIDHQQRRDTKLSLLMMLENRLNGKLYSRARATSTLGDLRNIKFEKETKQFNKSMGQVRPGMSHAKRTNTARFVLSTIDFQLQ